MKSDEGHNERVPEWLDYSPEPKEEEQTTNDLELWKSSMKKKEEGIVEKGDKKKNFFNSKLI